MHDWRRAGRSAACAGAVGLRCLVTRRAEAPPEVVALRTRERAREAKDFGEADRLRDEIAAAGWEVRDAAGGFQLVRP